MSRAARRSLERQVKRFAAKPKPLCKPGTHTFQAWQAAGETKRVVCSTCARTFEQVMEQSPEDLAIYQRWLAGEIEKAEHNHERDPKGPFVEGCPGCDREQALIHASPAGLAVKTAVKPGSERLS